MGKEKWAICPLRGDKNHNQEYAEWYHSKWGVPTEAYLECIEKCQENPDGFGQWYIVTNEDRKILGGCGIIENDFHDHKELTPNLCALYVEEDYRCEGIAQALLAFARNDMALRGIHKLYLVTDHTSLYEKFGWKFWGMVREDNGGDTRMYETDCLTIEKRAEGTPVYYYDTCKKDAETMIFVHPAFVNHTCFDEQVAYFAQNYRVITLDLLGHGKSQEAGKGDTIAKTADYLNQIMEQEQIEKAHFVGISIGAVLIQDMANRFPEKIASLSCFGGYDVNNFDKNIQRDNSLEQMKMMLKAIISVKQFAEDNKKISAYTPEAQETFYRMNKDFPIKSFMYMASLSGLVNQYPSKPHDYPVLIGCGAKDNQMELAAVKMWHDQDPATLVWIFPEAGHCVNLDRPQDFNHIIGRFLQKKSLTQD